MKELKQEDHFAMITLGNGWKFSRKLNFILSHLFNFDPTSVIGCVFHTHIIFLVRYVTVYINKTPLDSFGIQLTGGCPQHGDRHNIHDTIVHGLNALCHYAGLHTKHEPPNLFSSIEENKREKPDIAILNPQNLQEQDNVQKLLIDVSLPCPIAGSRYCEFEVPPSQIKTQIQHSRAKTCFNDKMTKYSKLFAKLQSQSTSI
jgi:hypothetical protein